MSVNEKMTAIADTIRSFTGKPGKLGLDDMPGAINEAVAANGYEEGYRTGYDDGEENGYINGYADGNDDGRIEGKQAEYDRFWDAVHNSIEANSCQNVFAGAAWTKDTFRPKYSILNIANPYMMFRNSRIEVDLPALLEELGIEITFYPGIPMQYTFYGTRFTRLGVLDFRDCQYLTQCCYDNPKLVTIDKVMCNNKTKFDNVFGYCSALENVTFEGELANNGLSFQYSTKLSKASIESVINVLSSTTSGLTVTLSKTAVETAFGSTTAAEWTALVATKSNWTISLV